MAVKSALDVEGHLKNLLVSRLKVETVDQMVPLRIIGENLARMLVDVEEDLLVVLPNAFASVQANKGLTNVTQLAENPAEDFADIKTQLDQLCELRKEINGEINMQWKIKHEIIKLKNSDEQAFLLCDAVFLLDKFFGRQ